MSVLVVLRVLQKIKVAILRAYYRFANKKVWRGQFPDPPCSTLKIPGPDGPITARMYAATRADQPLILYFHGGGWVLGDLETHHPFCQELAQRTACTVIAVDYRLAPEYPYPAATQDCLAAAQWAATHLDELAPNNGSLVIAGDSAGGNLTAATCLTLEGEERDRLAGAITLYPVVEHYSTPQPSYTERAKAKPLSSSLLFWFWDTWLGDTPLADASSSCPLRSKELARLPPLFNITAEYDPLRDEGRTFAEAVAAAGVPVTQHHFDQAAHGFACSSGPSADFNTLMAALNDWLQQLR